MTDDIRTRIANTLYQELSVELPAAIRGADAVIRELEADYVLVPKSHTLARNAFRYGEHYGI